jgi:uncharacterized GH25 family protein
VTPRSPSRPPVRRAIAVPLAAGTLLIAATALDAHDFWIIPDAFQVSADSTIHANGRSGTRFPAGSAVQPTRVADARLIGAGSELRITDMSVQGSSLRLSQKPASAGQYLIVVGLTPRATRSTPTGLLRFLRAEGGADEAARLEREGLLAGQDSLVFHSASYAATIVQYGRGGPRAFELNSGQPLQFVPLADPLQAHVSDTLHVRITGAGQPLGHTGVLASGTIDSTVTDVGAATLRLTTDASGVVHIPLTKAGLWNIRAAHVSRRAGTVNDWDVARATYVFNVGSH